MFEFKIFLLKFHLKVKYCYCTYKAVIVFILFLKKFKGDIFNSSTNYNFN